MPRPASVRPFSKRLGAEGGGKSGGHIQDVMNGWRVLTNCNLALHMLAALQALQALQARRGL